MAKQGGHLTSKEKQVIRQKRQVLRKDLKKRGIKSKAEFEVIARQMGLVYSEKSGPLGAFWNFLYDSGIWGLAGIFVGILLVLAIVAAITAMIAAKEDYTIALSGNLQRLGFDLSETEDFKNPHVYLTADTADVVNCISIIDVPEDCDDAEGAHNGKNYLAYTFWIRNNGQEMLDYDWQVVLLSQRNDVLDSLWMMIYDEGEQIIYAKAPEGLEAEKLIGYTEFPFYDDAAEPTTQYYEKNGKKGIKTTPFIDDRTVTEGTVEDFDIGDKHKYTVVMWVEGDDPDCTNENLKGYVQFAFKFAVHQDEENGVFDDFIYGEDDYIHDMAEEESTRDGLIPNLNRKENTTEAETK